VGFESWTAEVSYRMCARIHSDPAATTVVSIPDETRSKEAGSTVQKRRELCRGVEAIGRL